MSSTQLHIPSFWNPLSQNIIKDIEDNQIITKPVILICGAKNTGKSTLGRFLINQLLAKFYSLFLFKYYQFINNQMRIWKIDSQLVFVI